MKLKSIYIKGFKDPEREINLEFSDEPITVIYGVNGSGKTTLLKIIYATLKKDESLLQRENVKEIKITYQDRDRDFKLSVKKTDYLKYEWDDNNLFKSKSILFGTYRGMRNETMKKAEFLKYLAAILDSLYKMNKNYWKDNFQVHEFEPLLYEETETFFMERDNSSSLNEPNHLWADLINIEKILLVISSQYHKGRKIILEKINTAFFETIDNAFTLEENGKKELELSENFEERLTQQKDFVAKALSTKNNTAITQKLQQYIASGDRSILNGSNILKALLINILEKAEEPNLELESITKLIEIFNDHLYGGKKLVVESERIVIQLKNGKTHSLKDLSSGERHLLTFLTLFLIVGRNRNFFLIDEPEISLNLKWQRKLLPLLSELNPNAQIIAATHSPAISNRNTNYLRELV